MAIDSTQIGALSLASASQLEFFDAATFRIQSDVVRNDPITRTSQGNQRAKLQAFLEVDLMSTKSLPVRVSHLDLSALSLDAVDLLPYGLDNLELSVSYASQDVPSAGSLWKVTQNVKKIVSGSIRTSVPDAGFGALFTDAGSSAEADARMVLTFTINSVTTTLALLLQEVSLENRMDDLQRFTATLASADPGTGDYPTAPTGTTSLMEKALNAFRSTIAFVFTSHSSEGFTASGNALFDGFRITLQDGELVKSSISLRSTGGVTLATT